MPWGVEYPAKYALYFGCSMKAWPEILKTTKHKNVKRDNCVFILLRSQPITSEQWTLLAVKIPPIFATSRIPISSFTLLWVFSVLRLFDIKKCCHLILIW